MLKSGVFDEKTARILVCRDEYPTVFRLTAIIETDASGLTQTGRGATRFVRYVLESGQRLIIQSTVNGSSLESADYAS